MSDDFGEVVVSRLGGASGTIVCSSDSMLNAVECHEEFQVRLGVGSIPSGVICFKNTLLLLSGDGLQEAKHLWKVPVRDSYNISGGNEFTTEVAA